MLSPRSAIWDRYFSKTDSLSLDKALGYHERALLEREKSLGVDHPSTLNTVNNMAPVFRAQGQFDKALKYYERAFLGRRSRFGGVASQTLYKNSTALGHLDSTTPLELILKAHS